MARQHRTLPQAAWCMAAILALQLLAGAAVQAQCSWPGHCVGARCGTYDDCADDLVCISGRCGRAGSTGGGTAGSGSSGGGNGGGSGTSWPSGQRRATLTSYNIMSSDNTSPGDLAEHHVTSNFVNNVNIVAVHSKDWAAYKYLPVDITYRGRTGRFIVMDYCSDSDCGGCCTENANMNGNGFLLDVDSSAAKRVWGITNAESSLQDSAAFSVASSQRVDVGPLLSTYGGSK